MTDTEIDLDTYDRVVVLTVDALKAAHLPSYGYERATTPRLGELIDDSLCFRHCYAASSHTPESMPAMLTGQYPDRVVGDNYRLTAPTVADSLTVPTAMFHSNPFLSRSYGFDQGFDTFDDDIFVGESRLLTLAKRLFDKIRNSHYARASTINRRALDWIDGLHGEEFFLWNHYMDVHGPYQPPARFAEWVGRADVSARQSQLLLQKAIRRPDAVSEAERQTLIDLYDAEIRYVDEQIGQFLDELRRRSLLSGTLLLLTADHGEALGEDGFYEHPRRLTTGLTHVPLSVYATDLPSASVESVVGSIDLVPTVLDAVGETRTEPRADVAASLSGDSLFDVARGAAPDDDERVALSQVSESDGRSTRFLARTRSGTARATVDHDSDVTDVEGSPVPASFLEEHLAGRELGDGVVAEDVETSDEVARRLEHLGYLDDE